MLFSFFRAGHGGSAPFKSVTIVFVEAAPGPKPYKTVLILNNWESNRSCRIAIF